MNKRFEVFVTMSSFYATPLQARGCLPEKDDAIGRYVIHLLYYKKNREFDYTKMFT